MVKISVIVPVYNGEIYLRECIDSIVKQTYTNLEIILVNDGSLDNSGKILDEYAEKDTRIQVIHQLNKGIAGARNSGIARAIGDYIAFVDQDDILVVDMYERMVSVIHDDADLIMCNRIRIDSSGKKVGDAYEYNNLVCSDPSQIQCLRGGVLGLYQNCDFYSKSKKSVRLLAVPWGKLYKKSLLDNHSLKFIDGMIAHEDAFFNFMVFQHVKKIIIIDYAGYCFRINPQSFTHSFHKKRLELDDVLICKLVDNIGNSYYKSKKNYLSQVAYNCAISNLIECNNSYFFHKENELSFFKQITVFKKRCKEKIYKTAIWNIQFSNCSFGRIIFCFLLRIHIYFPAMLLAHLKY